MCFFPSQKIVTQAELYLDFSWSCVMIVFTLHRLPFLPRHSCLFLPNVLSAAASEPQ